MNESEELEKCCPLCGGKMTEILQDFNDLNDENFEDIMDEDGLGTYKHISLDKSSGSRYFRGSRWDKKYKLLKLKLKMIELGLIPK